MMALLAREQQRYDDVAPLKVDHPEPAAWTPPTDGQKDKTAKPRPRKKARA
jgi:hypothetical protein